MRKSLTFERMQRKLMFVLTICTYFSLYNLGVIISFLGPRKVPSILRPSSLCAFPKSQVSFSISEGDISEVDWTVKMVSFGPAKKVTISSYERRRAIGANV